MKKLEHIEIISREEYIEELLVQLDEMIELKYYEEHKYPAFVESMIQQYKSLLKEEGIYVRNIW